MDRGREKHLLHSLAIATWIYDTPTAKHSIRVASLAAQIASYLQLDSKSCFAVHQAALIHDLGKLALNPTVLNGNAALTAGERTEIHRHPQVGADILLTISSDLQEIAAAVRSHHEHVDGTGYPDGLVDEQISPIGRILTVADVYDALTSVRTYRSHVFSPAKALDYLVTHSGTQFDPEVVDAALVVVS